MLVLGNSVSKRIRGHLYRLTVENRKVDLPEDASIAAHLLALVRVFASRGRNVAWAILLTPVGGGMAYWAVEGSGPIKSLWWAVVTGSTVGYGDIYPQTTPGRGIAACVIISMVVLGWLAGAHLTAWLIMDPDAWTDAEQRRVMQQIDTLDLQNRPPPGRPP
jgi:hypothetical protein